MESAANEKLQKIIAKGKWHYVLSVGVIGWGLLTAILYTSYSYFIDNEKLWDVLPLALILFPIGGFFWGLFMWTYLNKVNSKNQQ